MNNFHNYNYHLVFNGSFNKHKSEICKFKQVGIFAQRCAVS